ncbi:hypothetical protein EVA_04306 [gut metagenome]|uniref:Uncharacterized protein n=1 Tax=gut metagenome TaxID=749906 RepID=J9D4K4_9ZZZZ
MLQEPWQYSEQQKVSHANTNFICICSFPKISSHTP